MRSRLATKRMEIVGNSAVAVKWTNFWHAPLVLPRAVAAEPHGLAMGAGAVNTEGLLHQTLRTRARGGKVAKAELPGVSPQPSLARPLEIRRQGDAG